MSFRVPQADNVDHLYFMSEEPGELENTHSLAANRSGSPQGQGKRSPSSASAPSSPEENSDDVKKNSKLSKFFGEDNDIQHSGPNFAAQPAHVTHIRIKKKFGEDVDLETTQDSALDSPVDDPHREATQNRRVQKFFGENFDVKMTEIAEKTHVGLKREISHDFQPSHVEVSKLNKFFGRHAPVQHREASEKAEAATGPTDQASVQADGGDDDDDDDDCGDDETTDERKKERATYKTNQKLRKYFGAPVDAEKDKDAKQFAAQPEHVKEYKLKKHFGDSVVVEKLADAEEDESDSESSACTTEDPTKQRKIDQFFGARVSETASLSSLADAMSSSAIGASALRLSGKGLKKPGDNK